MSELGDAQSSVIKVNQNMFVLFATAQKFTVSILQVCCACFNLFNYKKKASISKL